MNGGGAVVTGKPIRNFLAEGEPTGILLAEISNWTGKVLVAPRSQLDQLSKREEVRRTGVYLLLGPDPDDPSRAVASIGEGDNVLKRLLRHNKNEAKDFWERTVVIVSKDENLTKSHVRYLESRKMAAQKRISYANGTATRASDRRTRHLHRGRRRNPWRLEASMRFRLAQDDHCTQRVRAGHEPQWPASIPVPPARRALCGVHRRRNRQ